MSIAKKVTAKKTAAKKTAAKTQKAPVSSNISTSYNYCTLIKIPPRDFAPEVDSHRMKMIIVTDKKWVNGRKLKYYFYKGTSDGPASWRGNTTQMNVVRNAFQTWKSIGIGLVFEETNDKNDAEIRIGFLQGDGSWSYIGSEILSQTERTMNFGWDLVGQSDTAIHEIGHTLGAPHEHQNPNAGIVWNEEAVYNSLAQPPNNWSREDTFYNIIRKLPTTEVTGSTHDPNSIMHYPFGAGMINLPAAYRNGIQPAGGLSVKDKEFMKKFYPSLTARDYIEIKPNISQAMDIEQGGQKNFVFKPIRSKKYQIQTFGAMDTVMVLFEKSGAEEIYLSADDDSGTENNSMINLRLIKGRQYIIRVRLYYAEAGGVGSVMIF